MIEGTSLLIVRVCVPSAIQCFILCCLMLQSFKLSGTFIVFIGILDFGFQSLHLTEETLSLNY